ncbi:MAG TPA: cytochrome c oxidase assembly protein [Gaiellales bacterium]|nr:cytochrome c oxidase assembly protein [Gaiellales bacterium]
MAALPLHGYDGPPPLTAGHALVAWEPSVAVLATVALAAVGYVTAATRLRRRGDAWPVGRDISFVLGGLGAITLATTWWPGVYDDTLFWAHMVQHMVLSMVAPIFLALGAPVTLLLRTLPARPRQRLVTVLRSRAAAVVINPLVGFALLFGTPFALYYTGLYETTLRDPLLHQWLHVHFVLAGCIFFWPLIGIDPVPGRLPHPLRLILLFVTLPAHAWLGISIMSDKAVIAGDYYRALGRSWGPSLLQDQNIGGGLLWATGDLVGLVVVAALFVQWVRADDREAVRTDRRFDRGDDDNAFRAYNARLAALAHRDTGD